MLTMERHTSDLQALFLVAQLEQVKEKVGPQLQEEIDGRVEVVTDITTNSGTHSAVDLLRIFGHSESEAQSMGTSFGTFLKWGERKLQANTRRTHVGPYDKEVDECLYHPTEHAVIINTAYQFPRERTFRDVSR